MDRLRAIGVLLVVIAVGTAFLAFARWSIARETKSRSWRDGLVADVIKTKYQQATSDLPEHVRLVIALMDVDGLVRTGGLTVTDADPDWKLARGLKPHQEVQLRYIPSTRRSLPRDFAGFKGYLLRLPPPGSVLK